MPSVQLVFQIIAGLGPYFTVAILLALAVGLFLPWGVMHPQKWLFAYIAGVSLLPFGGNDPDGGGSLYKQITWSLLYVLCFVALVRTRKDPALPKVRYPVELLVLYGFLFVSIGWSDYALSSFKRYMLLVGLLLIATLSSRHALLDKSFNRLVDKPFAFFLLCGAAVALAWPSVAFDTDGSLRAYTSHKNTWGQFSLLCSVVFLNKVLTRDQSGPYLPLLLVSVALLVLSKSATSLLGFVFSSFCVVLAHSVTSRNLVARLMLLAGILSAAVAVLVYSTLHGTLPFDAMIELVYKATDKSSTLTGRTELWQLMGAEIVRHPWFGTGFGGFWVGLDGAAGALGRRLDWGPPTQAHSGYIDGLNEIGIVGMLLFLVVMLAHVRRVFLLQAAGLQAHFLLHLALLVSFLLNNYAESSLLQGTHIWWIIMACSIVEAHNRLRLQPQRPAQPVVRRYRPQF